MLNDILQFESDAYLLGLSPGKLAQDRIDMKSYLRKHNVILDNASPYIPLEKIVFEYNKIKNGEKK